jgi:threonine dehydrogenase-like Zn-dependent dehydrogenase
MTFTTTRLREAADRLIAAAAAPLQCDPVRDILGDHDIASSEPITRVKVAVIGSGNIGTALMIKVLRLSDHPEIGAMVGIDPDSNGLRRAQRCDVLTTAHSARGLLDMPDFDDIAVVFDTTSAAAHYHLGDFNVV